MAKVSGPRKGSMQFWPRKRAKKIIARVRKWANVQEAKPLCFPGYKAGMTHIMFTDTRKTSLTKVSIGFQAGGQAFSQIIFFQDKRAYDEFTSGSFAFDAQASAVAITAGAQAQAGSTGATAGASAGSPGTHAETNYYKGMAIFVHTKGGLMYEAAIAGQKFSFKPY